MGQEQKNPLGGGSPLNISEPDKFTLTNLTKPRKQGKVSIGLKREPLKKGGLSDG